MSARIEERIVEGDEMEELRDLMQSGFECLCALVEEPRDPDDNAEVMTALQAAVDAFRAGKDPGDDYRDPEAAAFTMGTLWGDLACDSLHWQWVHLTLPAPDEKDGYAVASPDRAWVIFPHAMFHRLLADKSADNTVAITFDRIKAGELPAAAPGAYSTVG